MGRKKNEITEDDSLAYGKYLQVAIFLQHSNRIQLNYKFAKFTWFLATFIGVGYSLSTIEVNLPIHPFLIAHVLCVASLCVIGIIWYLDIIVHEKNIATAVHQGLSLEEKYPWLPKTYHNIVHMHYLLGYVSMKSVFYLGCASILFLTIGFYISSYLYLENFKFWPLVLALILSAIPFLFVLSRWMTKSTDPYRVINKLYSKKKKNGN